MTKHSLAYVAKKLLKLFGPTGKHWTRGYLAKSKDGIEISVNDKKAQSFCMRGGLMRLGLLSYGHDLAEAMAKAEPRLKAKFSAWSDNIIEINDSSRFPTIKRALTKIANREVAV